MCCYGYGVEGLLCPEFGVDIVPVFALTVGYVWRRMLLSGQALCYTMKFYLPSYWSFWWGAQIYKTLSEERHFLSLCTRAEETPNQRATEFVDLLWWSSCRFRLVKGREERDRGGTGRDGMGKERW